MSWPPTLRHDAWARLVAAAPPRWVLGHARAVEGLAAAMAEVALGRGLPVDMHLVQAGALLHDVGRSVTQDVRHASEGAQMLRADGWPEALVLVVERHTGAGIDAEEARELGLPPRDHTPQALEEKIVAHADNLFSGTRRLGLREVVDKYAAKGLPHAGAKIQALHAHMEALLACDLEALAPLDLGEPWPQRGVNRGSMAWK